MKESYPSAAARSIHPGVSNLELVSRPAQPRYCEFDKNDGTIKSVSEFCDDTLGSRSIVPTIHNCCVIGENNSGKVAEIRLRFFRVSFFTFQASMGEWNTVSTMVLLSEMSSNL